MYSLIYADPCWRFKNWSMNELVTRGEKWARRNGRSPYPVMSTDDIAALPVGEISNKNSLCLMWATYPKLEDALHVMKSWGFSYVTTAFTWVKLNPSGRGFHFGLGYHTRGNPEIVILGKKGRGIPRKSKRIANLVIHPRGKHSAKPPVMYDKILRLYGDVSRIELFARNTRRGWDCWGNEVESSPGAEPLLPYIAPPYQVIIDEDEYTAMTKEDSVNFGGLDELEYSDGEQMFLM
jgi:N6-adenosine-specific RNA methylase IME4